MINPKVGHIDGGTGLKFCDEVKWRVLFKIDQSNKQKRPDGKAKYKPEHQTYPYLTGVCRNFSINLSA